MTSSSKNNNGVGTLVLAAVTSTIVTLGAALKIYETIQSRVKRQERLKYVQKEIDSIRAAPEEEKVLPSIIAHFTDFHLEYGATVEEANKKRTTKYYELARDAHKYELVPGVRSYPRLRNQREAELKRIFRFRRQNKSHRTVVIMCDEVTSSLLCQARKDILKPLNYSTDPRTEGVWIPSANILPQEHLHVTVAIPWWWHSIRPGNQQLSQELVARFRQALVLEFHHAFQLELERIVLLGGKILVVLWRCVGERLAPDDFVIFDRNGEGQDPIVKLRSDIVQCFTSEANRWGQQPLTYSHRHFEDTTMSTPTHRASALHDSASPKTTATAANKGSTSANTNGEQQKDGRHSRPKLERRNTIEWKTPGLGDSGDGFVHTSLARLPIDCLSMSDVDLEPIHRLCREATATLCGHRMVVSKFRFVETTGEGGESNPCLDPIFDEYVEVAPRVEVGITGEVQRTIDLHTAKIVVERSATIGNLPPKHLSKPSMDGLFDNPAILAAMVSDSNGNDSIRSS